MTENQRGCGPTGAKKGVTALLSVSYHQQMPSADAHRERSAPRSDVDGILFFADTFQAGQGRLLRTFSSSSNPSLPTTPVRSACVRGTPTRPSRLYSFLLLPPLQGDAQGQVLGEVIHCGIPSSLHVPGGGSPGWSGRRGQESLNAELSPKGLAGDSGTPG